MDEKQPDTKARRRAVLRTAGATGATLMLPSVAAATGSGDTRDRRMDRTVVAETQRKLRVKVVIENSDGVKKSLLDIQKNGGSVTIVDTAGAGEELSSVGTATHTDWITRYDGWYANIGDCGGKVTDNHYVANLSIETGDSLNEHESAIAAGIGATAGAVITKRPIGAAIGAAAGIVLDSAFLKHYDLSGRTFTLQCWDVHPQVEEFVIGAFLDYEPTAGVGRVTYAQQHLGHLGVGKQIVDYLK